MKPRTLIGMLIGVLSAGVSLGVGEFVAAFVRPAAAPVIAVGNRLIVLTPESAKRAAIGSVGTNDKTYLLAGIYVFLVIFGAALGVAALRHLLAALIGVGLLGAFGVYCALTANASKASDVIPTIVATICSAAALYGLAALAREGPPARKGAAPAPLADRRIFLQGTIATAGLALALGVVGRATQNARFADVVAKKRSQLVLPHPVSPAPALPPGTDLGKSGVPWVSPNSDFYRIDTALAVPEIDPSHWSVRIHGMVDQPITLTYAELLALPLIERWITLCCVSNEVGGSLIGNARWLGYPLAELLRKAGVQPGGDQLLMTSIDGMTIGAPTAVVMDGRDALLAVGMNGVPLPVEHGFPVRVVVPGLYGYVSACKWVVDIEVTTFSQQAYWVQGGWAQQTDIKLESRIDTPKSGKTVPVGTPVAIAGVAWDQHVGVSKVEVQIDGGSWQEARLAAVPSTDTWRQWVFVWTPPAAGSYVVKVRATDAAGVAQDVTARDVFPSGATGLQAITVRAR